MGEDTELSQNSLVTQSVKNLPTSAGDVGLILL